MAYSNIEQTMFTKMQSSKPSCTILHLWQKVTQHWSYNISCTSDEKLWQSSRSHALVSSISSTGSVCLNMSIMSFSLPSLTVWKMSLAAVRLGVIFYVFHRLYRRSHLRLSQTLPHFNSLTESDPYHIRLHGSSCSQESKCQVPAILMLPVTHEWHIM